MKIAVVGAGFSGAVLADQLSQNGQEIEVFEARPHIAGNCYTERDAETDVLIHKYGPHIFHTDDKFIWDYINQFSGFFPYINRVKTTSMGKVFSLPINLHTINQFFDKTFNPSEAMTFISNIASNSIEEPISFEEQALKFIGQDLYEAFFKGYTLKQWGLSPQELPASILKRLPVRFNYDDNYFNHKYQGMPINGYTKIIERMLAGSKISLNLNTPFKRSMASSFDHVFYSGPLDGWFDFEFGRLGYRTLDFKKETYTGDFQGCAVMNYGDIEIPFTRISEHKHFAPWENHEKTVIFKEYSRFCEHDDTPYYPIRLVNEKEMLKTYITNAKLEKNISFLGRLGTYRYLDMDVTIKEALSASRTFMNNVKSGKKIPTFFVEPL